VVSGVVTGCNARIKPHVALQTRIGSEGGPTGGQTGASHLPGGWGGSRGLSIRRDSQGPRAPVRLPHRSDEPFIRLAGDTRPPGARRDGDGTAAGRGAYSRRRGSGIADRGSDGCSFVLKRKPVAVNW